MDLNFILLCKRNLLGCYINLAKDSIVNNKIEKKWGAIYKKSDHTRSSRQEGKTKMLVVQSVRSPHIHL